MRENSHGFFKVKKPTVRIIIDAMNKELVDLYWHVKTALLPHQS